VYLACYVEALNQFLVADVRDLVEARGGLSWLRELKQCGQATTTLRISLTATLDNALDRMPRHRSMRMDGPEFRGRPLGHRLDPLRSELGIMTPDLFGDVVDRLLVAHGFVPDRDLDLSAFDSLGTVRATVGRLHYRYEWTSPLFTEFGFDRDSSFREESAPFGIQGDVLVVRHTEALQAPISNEGVAQQMSQLIAEGVRDALVFVNASEGRAEFIGGWRVEALRPMRVQWPQGLGSLAYNVLTATNVYFEFVDRLPWRYINLQ
jgi:hypothetical protein